MSSVQLGPLAGAGPSAIADKTNTCLRTFETILGLITSGQNAQDAVNDNLSRFRIWAGNIGAYQVDSRSADYRVRDAPEIKERIIELLDELEETNDEVCAIVSGKREDAALGDHDEHADDDDNDPTTELSELCLAAGDTISSLLKVAALLRKATGRDRYAKAATAVDDPFLESFDIKHVAEKFPKLDRMPWLRDRLGKANVQRRQYLRYARKHHERLAHEPEGSAQTGPAMPPARERAELSNIPESRPRTIMSSRPTLAPTDASTLRVDLLPPIQDTHVELLDETLSQGTSVGTSKAHHHKDGELDVFRLSELSKNGEPFECPHCWTIIQTKRQKTWRKHVLRDIRAWVCTFENCNAGLFEDRDAWFQHELDAHRRLWSCQTCPEAIFTSSASMATHLRAVHTGQRPDAVRAMVDAGSRPVTEIPANACPMCDEWELKLKENANELGVSSESALTVSAHDLKRHLSQHLEQLALFVIPPTLERLMESESRVAEAREGTAKPTIEELQQWRDFSVEEQGLKKLFNPAVQFHSGTQFQCKTCGLYFKRKDILERHEGTQHGSGSRMVTCDICGMQVRPRSLKGHQMTEACKKAGEYKMPFASHGPKVDDLSRHEASYHGSGSDLVTCDICGMQVRPRSFKGHQMTEACKKAGEYKMPFASHGLKVDEMGKPQASFENFLPMSSSPKSDTSPTLQRSQDISMQEQDLSQENTEEERPPSNSLLETPDHDRTLKDRSHDSQDAPSRSTHQGDLTAVFWEDEGTLCFLISRHGMIVARREDNNMINGTKLLSYAGLSRDQRYGLFNSEKVQHTVKTGPMYLRGIWVPFERAIELANQYGVAQRLHPLFVQNIGSLLLPAQNPSLPVTGAETSLHQSGHHHSNQVSYYQLQLKVLEQQNKNRLTVARDEIKRDYDADGLTQMARACRAGDLELVREWARRDPEQIELSDHDGNMPLHYAVANGDVAIVGYLLDQECGLDWTNLSGDTALIIAIKSRHFEIATRLFQAGADPMLRNHQGQQARDFVPEEYVYAEELRAALQNAVSDTTRPDLADGGDRLLQTDFQLADTERSSDVRGILKRPTLTFPEDSEAESEVTIAKRPKQDVPSWAKWTKISREFVDPQALEEAGERFEERLDSVIVLRVLDKEEIQAFADRTRELREEGQHSGLAQTSPIPSELTSKNALAIAEAAKKSKVFHPTPASIGQTGVSTSGSQSEPAHTTKELDRLGNRRITNACSHCRRRKLRCLLAEDDTEQRCQNCIRLKQECVFYPVD